jgi:hypothetical protein
MDKETAIKENKGIISPPGLSERRTKVNNGCTVEELEHDNKRNDFSLKVVTNQPPLKGINSETVKFITNEPILLEQPNNTTINNVRSTRSIKMSMSNLLPCNQEPKVHKDDT